MSTTWERVVKLTYIELAANDEIMAIVVPESFLGGSVPVGRFSISGITKTSFVCILGVHSTRGDRHFASQRPPPGPASRHPPLPACATLPIFTTVGKRPARTPDSVPARKFSARANPPPSSVTLTDRGDSRDSVTHPPTFPLPSTGVGL